MPRAIGLHIFLLFVVAVMALPSRASTGSEAVRDNYILGSDDQVTLTVADLDELTGKTFRIDLHGELNLPLAGRLPAAGLTVTQLESKIEDRLRQFLKHPNVVAAITEYRSQPVSVLGEVTTPGVHQVQGRKSLLEVLSLAGGLRPDAGSTIVVTREMRWGAIPLASAKADASDRFSVAILSTRDVIGGATPLSNIEVKPNDVISVPKSAIVYCVGSVHKPGGFTLGEKSSLSALQVLSLAEGLNPGAAPEKARILRLVQGSNKRAEIPINVKHLMAGKNEDLPLGAEDILFIPNSAAKALTTRTLEAALQAATGVAIYGRY